MSRLRIAAIAALSICICFAAPLYGAQLIVHEKPVRLRHIAGTIIDRRGMTVPYALIELRDPGDQHVMRSTYADGNGKFSFEDRKHGETIEMRITLAGYDTAQYTVSIARFGKEHMRAVIQPAT